MPTLAATTMATIANNCQGALAAPGGVPGTNTSRQIDYQPKQQSQQQHQYQQQKLQQQQQHQLSNHNHYHHPPLPQPQHPVAYSQHYDGTTPATTAAGGAGFATSLATFNGNSNFNVANGNGIGNGGNGNTITSAATASATSCNKSETSSTTNSIMDDMAGAGPCAVYSTVKKTSHHHQQQQQQHQAAPAAPQSTVQQLQASSSSSREDVASLGGASSANSQISATHINNGGSNNTNNNSGSIHNGNSSNSSVSGGNTNNNNGSSSNNNSSNLNGILKGSKENLLQHYCNSDGGVAGGRSSSRNTETDDDPGDGLGPLPAKWETAYTERGELYFIDHNTGTSHWLDPRLSKFQKKSLEDCGDDELPFGWERIEDSLYGTYYIDHVNRRTQYENPVLEAKRRAAEQKQQQQQQQQQPRAQTPQSLTTTEAMVPALNGVDVTQQAEGSVDIAQRGMQPTPAEVTGAMAAPDTIDGHNKPLLPYKFTRNPAEVQGERITTTLLKSARGLGITIVGGDDGAEEFLQIKSIVPHGPAWLDGRLQTGDILVYVNDTCVLGFTHHEMVNVFQSILPGETATLEVCRGQPLPFDPNDPNTEVVTTIAVDGITSAAEKQRRLLMDLNMDGNYNFLDVSGESVRTQDGFILMRKPEVLCFSIVKGALGFGFTIADSAHGQKVKKILDRNCCTQLQEGDVLLEINEMSVRHMSHVEVVQVLKDCSKVAPTTLKIQRGAPPTPTAAKSAISPSAASFHHYVPNGGAAIGGSSGAAPGSVAKLRKNFIGSTAAGLFRSKTPTAELYSTQPKEVLPMRPKTPLVDTRRSRARVQTPSNELNDDAEVAAATTNGAGGGSLETSQADAKSTNSLQELDAMQSDIPPYMDPYPKLVTSLSERLAEATLLSDNGTGNGHGHGHDAAAYHNAALGLNRGNYDSQDVYVSATSNHSGSYNPIYGLSALQLPSSTMHALNQPLQHGALASQATGMLGVPASIAHHHESCYCYDCQDYRAHKYRLQQPALNYYGHHQYSPHAIASAAATTTPLQAAHIQNERMQKRVNELLSDRRRVGFSPLDATQHAVYQASPPQHQLGQQHSPAVSSISAQLPIAWTGGGSVGMGGTHVVDDHQHDQCELTEVTLERQALGFGFRIVGGTEEGSQVTVGHIVPGGAAEQDQRITSGDEILSIDGNNVVNSSHHKVVSLMGEAALRGQVTMILRRRTRQQQHQLTMMQQLRAPIRYPYDVIVSRHENEGFGFVIISASHQYYGSTIGKLIAGSPADRCGELKVGDRIIAVNRIDIAGMSHGDVVNLIKESGLHVRLTIGSPKELNGGGTPTIAAVANGVGGSLNNTSAQPSPREQSQTQPRDAHSTPPAGAYFERPNTLAADSSVTTATQQLQQPQQLQLPQL